MTEPTFKEFFQVDNEYSMRNLVAFLTGIVASICVLYLAFMDRLTWDLFSGYLTYGASVYGVAKWQDSKTARSQINLEAEPTPITIPDAEQVSVKAGKVTVNQRNKK